MASIINMLRNRGLFHSNECTFFIALALISIAILFNLILLCPEILVAPLIHGDAGFHLLLAESVTETLKYGRKLTDPWQDTMGMGYPVLHHYQHQRKQGYKLWKQDLL